MPEKSKSYEKSHPQVYIRTFGCQMNVRDSEVIAGLLLKEGFNVVENEGDADIVLFNTCSVRQHAEDRVWSHVGRIGKRRLLIGIVGCMAQSYKEEVFKKAPAVDFVVGPSDIHKIPEVLKTIQGRKQKDCLALSSAGPAMTGDLKIWETDGTIRPEAIYHTGFYEDKEHAFVVISEGCSNKCSYCVVPYVRGALRNRAHKEIIREIQEGIDKGITKITLLGQNVNAYQSTVDFIGLLKAVDQIEGLQEFGFVTSHPKDASIDLFKAMAQLDKVKKSLHLPVQSGSDRILKLMNRGYTRDQYVDLVRAYRRLIPRGRLTTDVIVGFPSETHDDFLETYRLMKEVTFDAAYIFKYSPRPHTDASRFPDDVLQKEKEKRHKTLLDFQKELWHRRNAKA